MNLESGQVWRWHTGEDGVYYHCMLLRFDQINEYGCHVWEVLNLDSDRASMLSLAYFDPKWICADLWERIA